MDLFINGYDKQHSNVELDSEFTDLSLQHIKMIERKQLFKSIQLDLIFCNCFNSKVFH